MTEAMRTILWNLVCLSNDVARLTNEKKYVSNSSVSVADAKTRRSSSLENIVEQVSDQGMRKILYQKVRVRDSFV